MVISDVIEYKSEIVSKLISLPDIFTLINNPDIKKPSEMINKNIFPYMKIPNTTTDVKNYICFDFNSRTLSNNDAFKSVTINVGVICSNVESNILWNGMTRHDLLAGVIIEAFNWSNFLGFQLELVSDTENILEKEYNIRTLQFRNLTTNSFGNKVKIDGVR